MGFGGESFVPSIFGPISQIETHVPLDGAYADVSNPADDVPDIQLARLPVRTEVELDQLLTKRATYLNRSYASKTLFVADIVGAYDFKGEADFAQSVYFNGNPWSNSTVYLDDLRQTYSNNQANQVARDMIESEINSGVSFISYYGHSSTDRWSTEASMLTASQIDQVFTGNKPAIVTQWGCWNTYYVDPAANTMAHELLLRNNGAVSVAGAASQTSGSVENTFSLYFNNHVSSGKTIGEAVLASKQNLAFSRPGNRDINLAWLLLGFPELTID